ncbi:hypothetical protein RUMTOR_00344 [[Ruminococcus] torques ATCC 27756]|uniref:Uncharacterized protein n=1 Tax=[Ruminococcus] torques ATCC 27756 TaxID=411460 RepID=A5KJE6_9FIRM|nr:hypothetical protein RUMTOR_00344 [[Ruminococcus] torques ATCC 27756]
MLPWADEEKSLLLDAMPVLSEISDKNVYFKR